MMLIEQTTVPTTALPLQAFKDHLRLGTGFGAETLQDGLLESHLRAAIATIEGRIGKVLLTRRYKLVLGDWRDPAGQALPVAPVSAIVGVALVDAQGTATAVSSARYRLRADRHRPRLVPVGSLLPSVPSDGQVEVEFDAGFGAGWSAIPADLAQAVLLLAAQAYEHRHDGPSQALPTSVQTLIEGWRNVRVLGGGAA
jgi:uncharacterized phiE125 gp8 family phage protein